MKRLTLLILAALLIGLLAVSFASSSAMAQGGAGDAPAAANQAPAASATAHPESYLWWIMRSSGLIGLFILVLSVYFIALVVRLFLDVRLENAAPPELVRQCEEMLNRSEFTTMLSVLREDDSFLGRVLDAGMSELPFGLSEARLSMERAAEAETVSLEKQISMLAVLGTLGPMIGLIGTLKGMISAFSVIAMSDVQLKPSEVAGGISEALLLTFEGVALSVPAIYFFAVFRNRVSTISAATMGQADHLLRRVARGMRLIAPNPATASAGSAPGTPSASSSAAPPPRPKEDRGRGPLPEPTKAV